MTRHALVAIVAALVLTGDAMWAQQATAPAPAPQAAAGDLPVRRVVLYKSGVGYFEHVGRVRGNQSITIDFTSGQLDDVLKSLTALDLGGGTVSGVSYNTEASLDRRLGALRLPVGAGTSRASFLAALRGARLEVRSGSSRVNGRLLSVERIDRRIDGSVTAVDALSIVTDAGDLYTIALDPDVTVRVVEQALNAEVSRYLSLIASVRDQDVRRLTIATTGTGDRDLFVSYVSEVPVWKSTYRLVLPPAGETGEPLLQGWAIVDNTVGEDWTNVELSLVAGAPQSFVQSISQPYYVQRPVVPLPERALLAPQTHAGALGTAGAAAMAGRVTDQTGSVMPGVTVRVLRAGAVVAQTITDVNGRYSWPGLAPGEYQVQFTLSGFRTAMRQGVRLSGGMVSEVSAALEVGGLTESVTVASAAPAEAPPPPPSAPGRRGVAGGAVGGVAGGIPSPRLAYDVAANLQSAASAAELGDLFEYKITEPVTIARNQSALVPIVSGRVTADKVSVWNPGSGTNRPLRALWVTNTTGLTLDGGSFTVVEGQAFAGEGLVEPLKPGERRLLSYALDLGTVVDAGSDAPVSRVTRVQIARGLVIQQAEERQSRTYTARNEDTAPRELIVEHPVRPGWTLGGTLTPEETTAAFHRFRLTVAPKTTATFVVEETRPTQTQYSISSITDAQVTLLVRGEAMSDSIAAALREVLARKAEVARLTAEVGSRQSETAAIGTDQERVRENMRSLRGSSEERQLLQRYVRQLDEQETRLETLRAEMASLTEERTRAQAELDRFIAGLSG